MSAWRFQSAGASRYPAAHPRIPCPMRSLAGLAAIVASLAWLCFPATAEPAKDAPPKFRDYPAGPPYTGKPAPLRLTTPRQRDQRELYAAAAAGGVTFAGHYAIVGVGCGASCVAPDILDLRTGRTVEIPFTVSGWRDVHDKFEPVETKPDSRLIVF